MIYAYKSMHLIDQWWAWDDSHGNHSMSIDLTYCLIGVV